MNLENRSLVSDVHFRFEQKMPYLGRHFKGLAGRIILWLFYDRIYNFAFDCADTGWGICDNQHRNHDNDIYWDESKAGNGFLHKDLKLTDEFQVADDY